MPRLDQHLGLTRFAADESYKRALDAYQKGQFDDAVDAMNEAIEALPTKSEYYAARGFFYLEDGVRDKAQVDFEQALKIYPYEMLAHFGLGIIAYKGKNFDEALDRFTKAYRSDPQRPETQYYLALTCHNRRDNVAALQWMTKAAEGMGKSNDRRKGDADKWVKELDKMVGKSAPKTEAKKIGNAPSPALPPGNRKELNK